MSYAILQTDLNPPSLEVMKAAFCSVPGLTKIDAVTMARDAFGILVKNLSAERAAALQGALKSQGVHTEIVDHASLPALPPSKLVHRLDCLEDHVLIYDPLGRSFPVDWRHIVLIAAGQVLLNESTRTATVRPAITYFGNGDSYVAEEIEYKTRHEERARLILDLVLTRGVQRYTLDSEKFNYQTLGNRRRPEPAHNFALLVQDMIRLAPHAALNRGAYYYREQSPTLFTYPTQNAFHEETLWLLWKLQSKES